MVRSDDVHRDNDYVCPLLNSFFWNPHGEKLLLLIIIKRMETALRFYHAVYLKHFLVKEEN